MFIRAMREGVRTLSFLRTRRALHARAVGTQGGVLRPAGPGYLLPDVQPFTVQGPNGEHSVFVSLPSAPAPAAGYPVLVLLDGNCWVAGAAEALRLQSRFCAQSLVEPTLLVAVGYPGEAPINLGRRAYDFLPRHSSAKLTERFMQGAPWHQPGGADAFLDFLAGPLRADIARRYPVDEGRQTLCGHSFGGFFALYSLLTRPAAFRRYAALSPALWWDDARLLRDAGRLIGALPADLEAEVLMVVGETETPDRPRISARMIADAATLAARLMREGPSGLAVANLVLPGENHQSVPPTAFSRVLRFASAPIGLAAGARAPSRGHVA